jgi:hypothetical protein
MSVPRLVADIWRYSVLIEAKYIDAGSTVLKMQSASMVRVTWICDHLPLKLKGYPFEAARNPVTEAPMRLVVWSASSCRRTLGATFQW